MCESLMLSSQNINGVYGLYPGSWEDHKPEMLQQIEGFLSSNVSAVFLGTARGFGG